jgi:hypothetical protein
MRNHQQQRQERDDSRQKQFLPSTEKAATTSTSSRF